MTLFGLKLTKSASYTSSAHHVTPPRPDRHVPPPPVIPNECEESIDISLAAFSSPLGYSSPRPSQSNRPLTANKKATHFRKSLFRSRFFCKTLLRTIEAGQSNKINLLIQLCRYYLQNNVEVMAL
jgi:hypothetical protein